MSKTELLTKEDYWAIWIGGALLLFGLVTFLANPPDRLEERHLKCDNRMKAESTEAPFKTVDWYEAFDQQQNIKSSNEPLGKMLKKLTDKPGSWSANPLKSFYWSVAAAAQQNDTNKAAYEKAIQKEQALKTAALQAEQIAKTSSYQNHTDNEAAFKAISSWREAKDNLQSTKKKAQSKAYSKWPGLLGLMLLLALLFGFGNWVMGHSFIGFIKGFTFVFFLGIVSYWLAGQLEVKTLGIGYAAWAIVLGLLISNTIGTPQWIRPALLTEFYIKTGLILLGAEILLGKILAIGLPGIFVAWIVTPIVLVSTFWFGQRILRIASPTLNMTISADMSVCGVSAAVATAAACKASKEELTLAIGLSMTFTSVMMILMPAFINYMGMPEVLGGAWIGGTIDATGAVVAAGAFLGDSALNVAATIKMIQNVLIGFIAFAVAVYFATRVENEGQAKVGWGEIWKRFPKFILGFIGASVVFSIIYGLLGDNQAYTLIDHGVIRSFSKNLRGWLFCLAFVSIGLSTNFRELRRHFSGGKPLILYFCGQTLNLALTLLMAYIMFYLVFPHITENI